MSSTNGSSNLSIDPVAPANLAPALAQAVIANIRSAGPQEPQARPMASAPSFVTFATMLAELVATNPELERAVQGSVARSARHAMAQGEMAVPSTADILAALRAPAVDARGGTVARAFWWGFHIEISHADLESFLATAAPVNTIIGAIGGGIPSPAAPFIALAAAFVAGALGLLKGLDRGRGVYVSMSWFAPGIFIPTSV